jgi:hypothetical protein
LSETKFLNLGIQDSIATIGNDIPPDLVGGEPFPFHLWLLAANESQLRPSSSLFLEISSLGNCAELKSVGSKEDEASKKFGSKVSPIISGGDAEANSTIWARTSLWGRNSCQLDIAVNSAKGILVRRHLLLAIKPFWVPTLVVCLLGCFIQYALAGLIHFVEKKPVHLRWEGIRHTLAKGVLAFILGYGLNHFEIVKFGGTNNNSLLGYGIFSFLVGFWRIKPLWEILQQLSGASSGSGRGNTLAHEIYNRVFRKVPERIVLGGSVHTALGR